ncbi:MAG: phosphatase PAP2 family protein [Sphingomicrobium sp.]
MSLGWATTFADRVYGLWLPTQLVALFSVVVARPSAAKARALTCYAAAWFLLGVVAAMLLSSAGPVFHDRVFGGARFAGLHAALLRHDAWMVAKTADAMWAAHASGRLGPISGISALPSMHVAISLWMALTARTLAPRMAPFAWAYCAFIWVASVQLGWHYASDGLAGVAGMLMIWFAVRDSRFEGAATSSSSMSGTASTTPSTPQSA